MKLCEVRLSKTEERETFKSGPLQRETLRIKKVSERKTLFEVNLSKGKFSSAQMGNSKKVKLFRTLSKPRFPLESLKINGLNPHALGVIYVEVKAI